ncbi:nuclear transport factor 2 family protein [Dactylosporangium sp. CA-092794]|uniref:nuclear transport factor 2 family protein n=1 Tax=Dactylosporangium sp. CA-092794 TaxID=3239929 RepID=UPI003D9070D6
MTLSMEDRIAITDLIHLHGHLVDRSDFAGLRAVFAEDVVYDVRALGGGVLDGVDGMRAAAEALGDAGPVAHHVTNVVLSESPDGSVRALSKGLGVLRDGRVGSVAYDDTVRRLSDGWRITHRVITR